MDSTRVVHYQGHSNLQSSTRLHWILLKYTQHCLSIFVSWDKFIVTLSCAYCLWNLNIKALALLDFQNQLVSEIKESRVYKHNLFLALTLSLLYKLIWMLPKKRNKPSDYSKLLNPHSRFGAGKSWVDTYKAKCRTSSCPREASREVECLTS